MLSTKNLTQVRSLFNGRRRNLAYSPATAITESGFIRLDPKGFGCADTMTTGQSVLPTLIRAASIETALVESFNGRIRDGCLNELYFTELLDARFTVER
jgi:hypothetical protein